MNIQAWFDEARPRRLKRRVVLRPIGPTVACEKALLIIGTRILRQAAERVAADVLPAALSGKAQLMRDDLNWFERAMRSLRAMLDGLVDSAREAIREAFAAEDQRHSRRFNEAMRGAIGIDLGKVIVGEGLTNTIEAAVQRNVALIRGLTGDVAKRIETALIAAMTSGTTNRDIAKMLAREFGIGRRRAALIARDQAASFNGDLNRIRQTAMGVTEYVWSSSLDERVRGNPEGRYPNARPSHWDREGKRFKWSDAPSDGHPGQPINCFVCSTEVDLANGCHKLWRRLYSGPLTTIETGQGRLLQATPNHPILTPRGWMAIDLLKEGDDIIGLRQAGTVSVVDAHKLQVSFGDFFDTAAVLQNPATTRGAKLDFHGDGSEHDIDAIDVDGDLLGGIEPSRGECFKKFLLAYASIDVPPAGLNGHRSKPAFRNASDTASHRRVRSLGKLFALLRGHPVETDEISLAAVAAIDAVLDEHTGNNVPCDSEALRQCKLAIASGIGVDDLLLRQIIATIVRGLRVDDTGQAMAGNPPSQSIGSDREFGRRLLDSQPALYEAVRVLNKSTAEWSGHVYNLESSTGYYIANGVVSHNCRCVARMVIEF